MSTTVAKRSPEAAAQVDATAKGRALMGGTEAMQDAGKLYLPKLEAESEIAYQAKLKRSWLFNGYKKTISDVTGRVFDKPIEIVDATPELAEWSENIDLAGCDLSVFARRVFEDGIQSGVSYIMVDAPAREGVTTRAQAQQSNLRPYLVHLRVEDILGWRSENINNETTLTQLRIMETIKTIDPDDEFNELEAEQIRVLDRLESGVQVRLFRKMKANDNSWQLVDEPTFTGLPEITVVPFYANRKAFFCGEPMLRDLRDVNIAHWQSQSDLRNILHYAGVPLLHASGRDEDEAELVISASRAITSSNPQAKIEYVELNGKSIPEIRTGVKDLEFQMEAHGLQLLAQRQTAQSATGEALDAAKETSTLAMTADELQDALEIALGWMLDYAGRSDSVTVQVNKEFGVTMLQAHELNGMLQAVANGILSRETVIEEMKRRGLIRSDIMPDEEAERVANQEIDIGDDDLTDA